MILQPEDHMSSQISRLVTDSFSKSKPKREVMKCCQSKNLKCYAVCGRGLNYKEIAAEKNFVINSYC